MGQNKSVALITEHAETIVPMNDAGSTGVEDRNALVYITRWAQDPVLLGGDFTHIILTENLNDLNRTLIQHPYTSEISIPHPDASARRRYLESEIPEDDYAKVFEFAYLCSGPTNSRIDNTSAAIALFQCKRK